MNHTYSEKHVENSHRSIVKPSGQPAPDGSYLLAYYDGHDEARIILAKEDDLYLNVGPFIEMHNAKDFGFVYEGCPRGTTVVLTQTLWL